eukprot:SAG11_NODE_5009_length_1692_cov_2.854363_2_plen_76_part_00
MPWASTQAHRVSNRGNDIDSDNSDDDLDFNAARRTQKTLNMAQNPRIHTLVSGDLAALRTDHPPECLRAKNPSDT